NAAGQHIAGKRGICRGPGFYQIAIDRNIVGTGMSVDPQFVNVAAWNYIVIAADGTSGWTVYANGVAVKRVSLPGWTGKNTAPFRIGAAGNCPGFSGDIAEVSLYGSELSADQVHTLYRAGRNGAGPAVVQQSAPVGSLTPAANTSGSRAPIGVWRNSGDEPFH